MISILCVDDEPSFLELTRAFLELQGDILVDSAPSALEAIEMLKGHSYDAIVSDYMMPGMDGLKFLSHVRAKQGNVPFILFTGKGREEVVIQALNLGADFYLQKGGEAKAQFAELAHKIRQAVDRRYRGEALSLAEFSVEHAAVSTLWIDDKGRVLKANREAARVHGYQEEELLGMRIWDIVPDLSASAWPAHWEALESQGQLAFEAYSRTKDGRTFPVQVNANFLLMNGRKYNFAYVLDISERRAAERALRESEERFRGLVEGANSIILKYDRTGRISYLNSYAKQVFGYEERDIIGKRMTETIVSEEDFWGPEMEEIRRSIDDPDRYPSTEILVRTRTGRRLWIAWSNKAIRNLDGEVAEILSVGSDVTERHKAEEALRESQTRLQEAQRLGKLGDLEYDPGLDRVAWSDEVFRVFGLEPGSEALDFKQMQVRIHPDDLKRWQEAVELAYDGLLGVDVEYRVVRPDGEVRHVAGSFKTLRYANGEPRRFIGTVHDVTEAKRADKAWRETEHRYQAMADLIPDDIFVADTEGRLEYVNQRMAGQLGSSPDELIGRNLAELFGNGSAAEQMRDVLAEIVESGAPLRQQTRQIVADQARWLDVSIVPRVDAEGRVMEVIGTSRDITESMEMDERLLESVSSYKALAEDLPGLVYRVHLREGNRMQFFNDMFTSLTGYDPDEAKPGEINAFDPMIAPDDRPFVIAEIKEAIRNDKPFELEYKLEHKSGKLVYVSERGRPVRGSDGAPLFIDGVVFDISERRKTDETLRRNEMRFRQLANMLPAVVFEVDPEGRLLFLNESSRDLTGHGPEELGDGLSLFDLVAEHDRERARDQLARTVSGQRCSGEPLEVARKSGGSFPCSSHCAPIMDDGQVIGVRGLMVDISELKASEQVQEATLRIAQGAISSMSLPDLYRSVHEIVRQLMPAENMYIAVLEDGKDKLSFPYWADRRDAHPASRRMGKSITDYVLRSRRLERLSAAQIQELIDSGEVELRQTLPQEYVAVQLRSGDRVIGVMAVQYYGDGERLSDKDVEVLGFLGDQIALAIDKKRSEAELRYTLSLLQTTFESTDDGILIVGEEGRVLAYNDRFAKMWCLPEAILSTRDDDRFLDFVLEQLKEPDRFLERVRLLYDSPQMTSFDEIEFKDGRTFERFSQPIHEDQSLVGRIWNFRDVTERKAAERALNKSERELKSIMNSAKDAIFVKDREGKYVMVNEAMGQTFGVQAAELMGMMDRDLFGAEAAEQNALMDERVLAGQTVEQEVNWDIHGSVRVLSLIKVPLRDDQGNVVGICGIARDTSERKKVEKALQEANSSLNLLNSITRHDVLNQLMIIRGYSDLIRAALKDQKLLDYMDKVERATRNIRQQILFTRDFQKLGVAEARWQSTEELMDKALTALEIGKIDISVDLGGLEVFADPMLEKVFYNLVDNTLRHGERATRIAMTCHRQGPDLVLVYEDDGAGVKDEEKERIFDRGFGKNTGLGLFLTRAILNVTHIEIRETGVHGSGARFEMRIPDGMYRFREWDDA